jgi:hypothetical protein
VGAVTVCSATYCSEIGSMRSARGKDHRPRPPDLLFEIIARYGKAEHFDCAGLRFGNRRDGLVWLDRRRDCEGLRSDGGLSRLQGGGALRDIVGCDGARVTVASSPRCVTSSLHLFKSEGARVKSWFR